MAQDYVCFRKQHADQEWAGYQVNYVSSMQCGNHTASQKGRQTCITHPNTAKNFNKLKCKYQGT